MASKKFLSLSQDLILSICDEVKLCDLKNLRLTCRDLGAIVARPSLRKLSISMKNKPMKEAVLDLESLEEGPARYFTREITIGSFLDLRPLQICDRDSPPPSQSHGPMKNRSLVEPVSISEEAVRNEDAQGKILKAFTSLNSLCTFTWYPSSKGSPWDQETIWKVIQSLPNLRHLTMATHRLKFSIDFDALTHLESISILTTPLVDPSKLYTSLAKLYASSLTLTSISIHDNLGNSFSEDQSLHHLFSCSSANASASPKAPLRNLSIHGSLVSFDQVTLPHLRHLTSLKLHSLHWISLTMVNSPPYDIWKGLIGSGIHLQEIDHDMVPASLLTYLSSYSGLKRLSLIPRFNYGVLSDMAAVQFFEDALPHHTETLEELKLMSYFEGKWCFTPDNLAVIMNCKRLRRLFMSVIQNYRSELGDPWTAGTKFSRENIVKTLIDGVVTHLPRLTTFCMMVTSEESFRNDSPPTSSILTLATKTCVLGGKEVMIRMRVEEYRPPLLCRYLPQVMVTMGQGEMTVFEGKRREAENGSGTLVYVQTSRMKTPC